MFIKYDNNKILLLKYSKVFPPNPIPMNLIESFYKEMMP